MSAHDSPADVPIEAVIFDRDGVIAFFDERKAVTFLSALLPISLQEMTVHWQALGQRQGWPRTLAEEATFFKLFWQQLGEHCGLDASAVQTLIDWDYKDVLKAFDDAQPVLAQLKQRGLKIGVLSNFSLASLEPSLEHLGLLKYVDVACAATVIGVAKPHAAAFEHVATQLGVAPSACLFIDDEAIHVAGAQDMGMRAYLVDRSGSTESAAAPAARITSLFEVLRLL